MRTYINGHYDHFGASDDKLQAFNENRAQTALFMAESTV